MKTKVLITVKAYPAISTKYGELVCTAGIKEDGSWIRIYPITYRKLEYENRFKKYDWIELDLVKNTHDFRHESFRPTTLTMSDMVVCGHIDTDKNAWLERRKIVLNKVYSNLKVLIEEAKDRSVCTSLASFKPTEIIDFYWKETTRDWKKEKVEFLKSKSIQMNIFETDDEESIENFELVDKLPYNFYYRFKDEAGQISNLMIEDWEAGMLFWNSLVRHNGDEQLACEDVKKKYFDNFAKTKDLYFFLGTRYQEHAKNYKNPFSIIGVFYPKHIIMDELF